MWRLTLFSFLIGFLFNAHAKTDSLPFKIVILPQYHIIPVLTPDTRAHQLSAIYTNSQNLKHEIIGSMGGVFPIAHLKSNLISAQLSAASTLYTTLLRSNNAGTIINNDYLVDIYLDISLTRNFKMRTGFGHHSHHLSDDALIKNLFPTAINYVKDYYQAGLVYLTQKEMIYALLFYNHNFKTTDFDGANNYSGNIKLQFGAEKQLVQLNKYTSIFAGTDLKLRQEIAFGSTQNIQLGLKIHNNTMRNIRWVINYTSGFEERGQFYKSKRNFFNSGLLFQF
jgi:hypothetical protein